MPPDQDAKTARRDVLAAVISFATWILMWPVLRCVPFKEAMTGQGPDHDSGLPSDAPPCDDVVVAHIKAVYDGVWSRRTYLDGKAQWLLGLAGVLFSAMALFASRLASLKDGTAAIVAHVGTAVAGAASLLAIVVLLAYMREGDWNFPDYTQEIRRASTPEDHRRAVADDYLHCVRENDRRLTFQSKLLSAGRRYLLVAFLASATAAVASVAADAAETIWAEPMREYLERRLE